MLRLAALACLTATAASLTTFRPLRGGLLSRGSSTLRPRNHAASRTPLIQLHALAAGWEAQVDEASGQTYYLNSNTGESQWEPPPPGTIIVTAAQQWRIDGVSGVAGFSGVDSFAASNKYYTSRMTAAQKKAGCRLEHGRKGRPCQLPYRVRSGEERVLSRYNMVEQNPSVAKEQCVVRCAADGTGILASAGESPTLWRAAGGGWSALYQGQVRHATPPTTPPTHHSTPHYATPRTTHHDARSKSSLRAIRSASTATIPRGRCSCATSETRTSGTSGTWGGVGRGRGSSSRAWAGRLPGGRPK